MKKFNVIIATGGTGGHIFPALSCGEFFEKNDLKVLYLLSGSKIGTIEKQNVIYLKSYHFDKNPLQFLKALCSLMLNTIKSIAIIKRNRPCAILATGSYAVAPVLTASVPLKIPFYLLEQNVIPGLVNKIFSKFAKATFVAFEVTKKYLRGNVVVSGLPLREEAKRKYTKEEARRLIGIPEDKTVILIIGGSLGARGMVEKIIPFVGKLNGLVIVQTGTRNFDHINSLIHKLDLKNCILVPFIREMGLYYSAADIVISRAGASSCMEIVYHEKPAILVPYPYSRDRHQYYNASELEKAGIAVVIEENRINEQIEKSIKELSSVKDRKPSNKLLIENSEEIIYKEMLKDAIC